MTRIVTDQEFLSERQLQAGFHKRKGSNKTDARMGSKKVLDVYENEKNGVKILGSPFMNKTISELFPTLYRSGEKSTRSILRYPSQRKQEKTAVQRQIKKVGINESSSSRMTEYLIEHPRVFVTEFCPGKDVAA